MCQERTYHKKCSILRLPLGSQSRGLAANIK